MASKLTFTPHTLRSSRAIHLILQGFTVDEVMNRIGWTVSDTFKHYIRLPISAILKLKYYNIVVNKINSQL